MADYDEDEDFFEEEETADKIHAAFESGTKGVTGPPSPYTVTLVVESGNTGFTRPSAAWVLPTWITGDSATSNRADESIPA